MSNSPIHPADLSTDGLLGRCEIQFVRRSGPGGQHRNKVATAVVLRHRPTDIRSEASERRSQAENKAVALRRLRINLALGVRVARGAEDVPSVLWRSRCGSGRVAIAATHGDFPSLLAEALDVLAADDFDLRRAATRLACTPSQLLKLLKKEPAAIELVNEERLQRGVHPLR